MKCVRPSSLHIASLCRRSPWLSAHYPESHDVTRQGSAVDRQVTALIRGQELPDGEDVLPEVEAILDWLHANYPAVDWAWYPQQSLILIDPKTGDELTRGTTDLIAVHRTAPRFAIVDWKKKGQLWAGRLPPPDENPQMLAYVAGAWQWIERALGREVESAEVVLACWDEHGVTPLATKEPITRDHLEGIIDMVLAVPSVDPAAQEPEASIGEHCDDCYQRMHCSAHLAPAGALVKAGLETAVGFEERFRGGSHEDAVRAALAWLEQADRAIKAAKALRDMVRAGCDAYVKQQGPLTVGAMTYGPVEVKGARSGATVSTLEEHGLEGLIRPGKTSVKCKWYKALNRPQGDE